MPEERLGRGAVPTLSLGQNTLLTRTASVSKAGWVSPDKVRADPARDASRLAELRPLEQRYLRKLAERRGARDVRLDEFRWWLEELRVGLFAQELKTPHPVSARRLEKIWDQAFA